MPCIVGKKTWEDKTRDTAMSTVASVTDEAFLLLVMENSWSVWKQMANNDSGELPLHEQRQLPLYTGTPGGSGRNEGWGDKGMKRFNELCRKIEKDREDYGKTFDSEYMLIREQECSNSRKRKTMTDEGAVGKPAPYYDLQDLDKSIAALRASRKLKENNIGSENARIVDDNSNDSTSSSRCAEKDQEHV